jgi:hypothetical protein
MWSIAHVEYVRDSGWNFRGGISINVGEGGSRTS